jgi:Ribbon-helix-helix protein, copG family
MKSPQPPAIIARVTPELHEAIERQAALERRTVSEIVRQSVRAYLNWYDPRHQDPERDAA